MIFVPPLLPGEWLEGYRCRLGRVNSIHHRPQLERMMKEELASKGKVDVPRGIIPLLAAASDQLTTKDIVLRHTLWPFHRAVDRPTDDDEITALASIEMGKQVFSRALRPKAWICRECIEGDLKSHHFSYWRRSHQLPGQFVCPTHGVELQSTDRNLVKSRYPDEVQSGCSVPNRALTSAVKNNSTVTSALVVMNAILEDRYRPDRYKVSRVMTKKAQTLGCEPSGVRFPGVVDAVRGSIPLPWLKDAMPSVYTNLDHYVFVNHIFDLSLKGLSGTAVAVVAAALYGGKTPGFMKQTSTT